MKIKKIFLSLLIGLSCSKTKNNPVEVVTNSPITPTYFTDTTEFCKRIAEDDDYKECLFYTHLPSQTGQGWIETCPFGEFLINDKCEKLSIRLSTDTNQVSLTSDNTKFSIVPDDYKNQYFYKTLQNRIAYLWDTKENFSFYQEDQIYVNLIYKQVGFMIRNDGKYVDFMWPLEAVYMAKHEDNPLYPITAKVEIDGHVFEHADYNRKSFEKWCSLFNRTHKIRLTEYHDGKWDRFENRGLKYSCTDHNSDEDTWRFDIVCDKKQDTNCDFVYFSVR